MTRENIWNIDALMNLTKHIYALGIMPQLPYIDIKKDMEKLRQYLRWLGISL